MIVIDFTVYLDKVLKDRLDCNVRYTATDALRTIKEQEDSDSKESPQSPTDVECLPVLTVLKECVLGKQRQHLLLTGQPGSGKSTTLKRLLLEIAEIALLDTNQPVPVFVQLKGSRSIRDLIIAEFTRAKLKVTVEQINDLLLTDKLILLLDGVNEIPSDDLRSQLRDFREDYLSTPMIFTTRDLSVCGDFGIKQRIEMSSLTESQMEKFVQKYLPEDRIELLKQLQGSLREIAETPLLLKMLCDIFKGTKEIPKSRGALFLAFDQKYTELKQDAPIYQDFHLFRSELLAHLAFVMIQGDPKKPTEAQFTISLRQAETILEKWLNNRNVTDAPTKAKRWLENLLKQDLLQVSADVDQVEFHHQLFQEFYAAKKLLMMLEDKDSDLIDDKELQYSYLNYLKWTESISLMLAMLNDEAHAVRIVEAALVVDKMLGSRLAGEVKPEFQEKAVHIINMLDIPEWLKIKLLGKTNSEKAVPILLDLIKSEDSNIRREIVKIFGKARYNSTIISCLREAICDVDESVRRNIVKALGEIGCQSAIPELIISLKDKESSVRRYAVYALGKIGESSTISALSNMIEDENESVCKAAEKVLKEMSADSSTPVLLESTNSLDTDALPAIQPLLMLDSKGGVADLSRMLKDSNKSIRLDTAKALKRTDSQTASPMLAKLLENKSSVVRRQAAEILGIIGSKAAIPALVKAIVDEKTLVRKRSAEALGVLRSPMAIPALLQAIEDSEPMVRGGAAIALGQIGDEKTVDELLKLFSDKTRVVWGKVAESLGNFNNGRAAHILPKLQILIFTESGEEAFRAVIAIQAKCQFYNYDTFHTAPVVMPSHNPIVYPIYNIERVGNLNTGTVKVNGDMIGESHKIFVRPLLKR